MLAHQRSTAMALARRSTTVLAFLAAPAMADGNDFVLQVEAPAGQAFDSFGADLDADGADLVVGAPGRFVAGQQVGIVFVFDVTTGTVRLELMANDPEPNSRFGEEVAIAGDRVVVGAGTHGTATGNAGAAYLFDRQTGAQIAKLEPVSPSPNAGFGSTLDADGSYVVIGSPSQLGPPGMAGAAYVFDLATGALLHELGADTPAFGDRFGTTVAIDGDVIAVGAPFDDGATSNLGAVYLFDAATGVQTARIEPAPGTVDQGFGRSLGLESGRLVVGAGATAPVSVVDVASGAFVASLAADPSAPVVGFSDVLALDGTRAAVALGIDGDGVAYVFDVETGTKQAKLPTPLIPNDGFGNSLLLFGDLLAVGAPLAEGDQLLSGVVFIYDVAPDQWIGFADGKTGVSGIPNLTGVGAVAAGSNLTFELSEAAPNQASFLVVGAANLNLPLLDGVLVPSPDLVLDAVVTTPNGRAQFAAGLAQGLPPGTTLYVQAWVIDPVATEGVAASHALARSAD